MFGLFKKKPKLMVAESPLSTWDYHLRLVTDGEKSVGPALCSKMMGWNTSIPVRAFGTKDGFSKWCPVCKELSKKL